ncbi:PKD domain-containing protein [Flavobacterium sp. LS1R47]|uniref:PKD domain-containing protein n=1 Tax=Flavobacterium frigoritolerans TaxID=2987686 RepID=A0A9X3CA82_9FLAO|nr:PKD domain-containing protein [Flavobacterium frigoritolerans]MCV9934444.1 PKD domain-containing protein [Flavobacterium frigoritolerans]
MKKNYLVILFFLGCALNASAQTIMGCGTQLSQKEQDLFRQSLPKIETAKKAGLTKRKDAAPYIIPVVFHILNDGSNIGKTFTKAQMQSRINDAIDVCNKDFNGLYPAYNTVDPRFEAVKSKMNIQFVLATVDPDGNLLETPGMNWHPDAHIVDGYDSKIYNYMYYGKNGKYYLDIVVVDEPNPSDGVYGSGHAFLPVQDVVPHVTYNHRYIGTTGGSDASFQFAKEMSHEFGHYFGLQHTFQNGCDPINDGMADTPPTTQGFGCNLSAVNSCGVIANYQNLMDYNVDCQSMFTKDQTNAMTYWLDDMAVAKYPRGFLWQNSNLASVGVISTAPIAQFTASTTAICNNKSITFKDVSLGLPTSRTWTFAGGSPATSTTANPTVTYATPGIYTVSLTATNALGNDTKTITSYIKVDQKSTINLTENFSGAFPPDGWSITNPDAGLGWEKRKDVGNGDSACMIMNNADNAVVGELDYIQLPYYNFTNGVNSQLFFDVAYTKFDDISPDVLEVEVSTDCGANWTSVYSKTHTDLQTTTTPITLPNNWIPNTAENWRKEIIDLGSYIGNPNVTIRFKNKSGYGTRIWIDNVNVAITQSATPISDFSTAVTKTNCASLVVPFKDTSTGNPTTWLWSFPGGTPTTSTAQNPIVAYNTNGTYTVSLTTTNPSGTGTSVTKSNFITVVTPTNTSYTESFEGTFPPAGWEITNLNNNLTWEKSTVAGRNSSSCMIINNADNAAGDIDEITLHPLNLSVGATDFSFDIAYAKFDADSPDLLNVLISKDCGVTWTNLYSKTHTVLETATSTDPNNWVPTSDSDWRTERISLAAFKGNSNVLIKFVNTSGYGARIWIDNLKFTFDSKEKPYSDFNITSSMICSDLPVQFSDASFGEPTSWLWSFSGGTPATSTSKNPSVIYNIPGNYDVTLVTTNAFGQGTTMSKTNAVTIKGKNTLPVTENFNDAFPQQDWQVLNLDADPITWEKRTDVGKGDSSCLVINNADAPTGMVDELILKSMDFTTADKPHLHFDLGYTQYLSVFSPDPAPDQIDILVSSDCGVNWTNVYSKNQLQLQTVQPPIQDDPATTQANETNDWKPTQDSDWRSETIDLSVVKNQSSVLIKVRNTSGYGTRVWFDNFKINNSSSLNIKENKIEGVIVYPNPSKDLFTIYVPSLDQEEYDATVYSVTGQLILNTTASKIKSNALTIDLSEKVNGVYILKIKSSSGKIAVSKLIKE